MKYIDLHTHSNISDGTLTPKELIEYAHQKGLSALALTDHDTTDGLSEAMEVGHRLGIEIIPGIEFSTNYYEKDIHILGYYVDYKGLDFQEGLKQMRASRDYRNHLMIERFNELGIPLTYEDVTGYAKDAVITRAHFAAALVEKGYVRSREIAFSKYLKDGGIAFIPREKVLPKDAIQLILKSGGVPVLAHPLLYGLTAKALHTLVESLTADGLLGIEAIYALHTPADESNLKKLAREFNLIITGGSDYHGANKPHIDLGSGRGNLKVPYELLTKIKEKHERI